jgi:hypothetical protein
METPTLRVGANDLNEMEPSRPLAIILGGPAMSLMSEDDRARLLARVTAVDALVRFDGEVPLLQLALQAINGHWQPDVVANVSSLRHDGSVIDVAPIAGPRLEDLPFAKYDERLMGRLVEPEIGIVQARGCYWGKCDYCDFVELYEGSPSYRTRTAKRVADEIDHQSRTHHTNSFSIITEAIPPAFADRLCRELKERGANVRWTSFAMVDRRFTADLLVKMKEAGCEYLIVGLESMNDRVLALVQKAARREDNLSFLRNAKRAGLRINVNLIPDLPTTTLAEAEDDLRVLAEAADLFGSIAIFPFEASKSSDIGRNPAAFGLTMKADVTDEGQAQFASNHLQAIDLAMPQHVRREVYARYRESASRVNGGRRGALEIHDATYVRVPQEGLDLIDHRGKTICFDHESASLTIVPRELAALVDVMRRMEIFPVVDLTRQFEPAIASTLLNTLVDHNLLTVVAHTRTEASR